jgi:small subunit ribosomal protein S14
MKHLFIKDQKKRIKFAKNEKKRIILKYLVNNTKLLTEQRILLTEKLKKLNKKTNQTKINNRCSLTYRGRSNINLFKLSRIRLRELLSLGLVPGYKKAVW